MSMHEQVGFSSREEHDIYANYRVLQAAFVQLEITKVLLRGAMRAYMHLVRQVRHISHALADHRGIEAEPWACNGQP